MPMKKTQPTFDLRKLTIPIGLLVIIAAVIAGWSGACARTAGTLGRDLGEIA